MCDPEGNDGDDTRVAGDRHSLSRMPPLQQDVCGDPLRGAGGADVKYVLMDKRMSAMRFTVIVRRYQKMHGISMREVSRRIGISAAQLSRIYRTKSSPGIQTLRKTSQLLHVAMEHLA